MSDYEIKSVEEAKDMIQSAADFLEFHAQTNHNPRTLRVHHELDLQADRLEEILENISTRTSTEGGKE